MNIGVLLYPGCIASGLLAFSELLYVANQREGKKLFTVTWLGLDKTPINPTLENQTLQATLTPQFTLTEIAAKNIDSVPGIDALIVPGFWASANTELQHNLEKHQSLITALKKIPAHIQLLAYCSGVCWLAAAGKLNRLEATSTWWMADFFHTHYPEVQWRFTHTCIASSATTKSKQQHTIQCTTAAGVNGYLPIAQQLIINSCGEQRWRDIAEIMVIPRPEKKLQPFQNIQLMQLKDPLMRKIYLWIEQQAAVQLSLVGLANKLNMSERTLARKVKTATGLPCAQFMKLIKLHQASEQLIYSHKAISNISNDLGFSDDAAFRRSFKSITGYTPSEYRLEFKR
ncbi:MAG: hypothetical protein K0Q67_2845 [Cellvibrio sp.]|jgi:transcriptional regulator GlxA family with amidase domain|nr:hypothetical protein [Cellvibrio sp.]